MTVPPYRRHAPEEWGMKADRRLLVAFVVAATAGTGARAQDWPTHPMTLVVGFAAGGSSDAIGRITADGIRKNLKHPVVIENIPGSGGMRGGARVAKAAPDGYQFIIGNVGTF